MLRTFCPKRKYKYYDTLLAEKVESWLADEWRGIDDCIDEQHCRDGALCICICVHDNERERPSFNEVVRQLHDLRLTMERASRTVHLQSNCAALESSGELSV
eukprot:5338095-Amphidinium_carterae.1